MRASPIEELGTEHRLIEKVANAMNAIAAALDAGAPVRRVTLRRITEFLRIFADQCHHGKEEAILFPVLEQHGVPPTGCPIGGLLAEHNKGRSLVDELARASDAYETDSEVRARLAETLRSLNQLYTSHIWKEDNLLFPLAARILSEDEASRIEASFRRVDEDVGSERLGELVDYAVHLERDAAI